jgi:predicted Fe-Mo cluster-binding NifX family protein
LKVVVATNQGGLDDMVSPVFGRCPTYTVVECEGNEIKDTTVQENPGFTAAGGAGIQAAQYVSNLKSEAVVAGNFGPNAAAVLSQTGIKLIQTQGNVREVVAKYLKGELQSLTGPTVRDHFGMGRRGLGGRGGFGRGRAGRWG